MAPPAAEFGSTVTAVGLQWPRYPFPGLRPFRNSKEADESLIFYGRSTHKDDVLERLNTSHLVSVVGPSGCGKSSLVKVGVVPALQAGLLTRAGYDWRTLEMRPGNDPVRNLAAAFAEIGGDYDQSLGAPQEQLEQALYAERSALWVLMEHLAPGLGTLHAGRRNCLLLLIDQFEEIFSGSADMRAVDSFVGLLTQFFRKPHPQLYLILTMRSDFISQCANFPGLAEVLNHTQYITPVLRGADLRDAIARPIEAYHGAIEPSLVSAIVSDMGAGVEYDADNLPLMQHALLWLWQKCWRDAGVVDPPTPAPPAAPRPHAVLTLATYQQHGGLSGILNRHAEDIFAGLRQCGPRTAAIAEVMFRRLSERDASLRYKRAPALASTVCQLASCTSQDLEAVVNAFSDANASFVERRNDPRNPLLDISHESLIRQWSRLRDWADDEADKLATFRRVAGEARSWERGNRSPVFLKTGGYLAVMDAWWEQQQPTPEWTKRYTVADGMHTPLSESFPLVLAFRAASQKAHRRARASRRMSWLAVAAIPMIVLGGISWWQLQSAKRAAEQSKREAVARAKIIAAVGEGVRAKRSQTLALEIAQELLDPKAKFSRVPEAVALANDALSQLREMSEISVANSVLLSADYSPHGASVVTAKGSQLYFIRTDNSIKTAVSPLNLDKEEFKLVRWNSGGDRILITTRNGALYLLEVKSEDPLAIATAEPHRLGKEHCPGTLPPPDGSPPAGHCDDKFTWAAFSGDGRVVAAVGQGSIRFWNARDGKELGPPIESSDAVGYNGFAVSKDGKRLAAPHETNHIQIFDLDDTWQGYSGFDVEVCDDPVVSVAAGASGSAGSPPNDPDLRALAFDPTDPDRLLVGRNSSASICDLRTVPSNGAAGRHSSAMAVALRIPAPPAIGGDGTRVGTPGEDGAVSEWDLTAARPRQGAFSDDGTRVATAGEDGAVRVWDLAGNDARFVAALKEITVPVTAVRFCPGDREHLVSGNNDGSIRLWKMTPSTPVCLSGADLSDQIRQQLPMRNRTRSALTTDDRREFGLTDENTLGRRE